MDVELGQMLHLRELGQQCFLSPCVNASVYTAPSGVCTVFLMCCWTWDASLLLSLRPINTVCL